MVTRETAAVPCGTVTFFISVPPTPVFAAMLRRGWRFSLTAMLKMHLHQDIADLNTHHGGMIHCFTDISTFR
jgi:hypothetical protein